MSEPAVAVRLLTKVFRSSFRRTPVVAVQDVTLQVERGETYGLLGPNGSGKSTTLKAILGLVTPTEGSVSLFGRDSREVASRQRVGFLPESPYFHRFLDGRETLHFYGRLCGLTGAKLKARADELLHLVGLEDASERRLRGYSKGMLQRIGLAQALIHDPDLVVLDEPTAGVDPAGTRVLRDLILELKARGKTVLLSSHLLGQVQEVCDRVGILAQGRLVREGTLKELVARRDRTHLLLEDATPAFLRQVETAARKAGVTIVEQRPAETSLEDLFLEATRDPEA